jgi:Endonuclease/Exonuclease/phosphatase family
VRGSVLTAGTSHIRNWKWAATEAPVLRALLSVIPRAAPRTTWKWPGKYPHAPAIPAPCCPGFWYCLRALASRMKIASFNVNNIRKRLPNLPAWVDESAPDVVCLQELKTTDADFPTEALRDAGYEGVWRGQKSWNGVAILARRTPILTGRELPGDPEDNQNRYIEAAVNGVIIASVYAPNGNPQPGPKFTYKLTWLERLAAHAAELYKTGVPVVTLEDILASGVFPAQAEALRLYRSIGTMNASAPLPFLKSQTPTWAKAAALVSNWGLNQLADRLSKLAEDRRTGS